MSDLDTGAGTGAADDLEALDDELDEDLDEDADEDAGNRVLGARSRDLLEFVARSIVDDPDAVAVEVEERRGSVVLRLHVAPDDMGKVIGRRGHVAQAIRSVVRAAGVHEGVEASVDIVD